MLFPDAPLLMVEDDRALRRLAERLAAAPVIAVDTEADSMYHYQEKVCLIQLSDALGDIIIDPLRVRDLSVLAPIFADPSVVKVFHGADYDIVSLRRDFGFQFNNLFDTLIAAQFLGLQGLGLADLISRYFGIELDKKHQRHDWSQRPLEQDHLDYARGDTHWLLALREILVRQLRLKGRLAHHTEECAILSTREWNRKAFDPDGWQRIKGANLLSNDAKKILRQLYLYRDDAARDLDRPTYKVMADAVLLDVAQKAPRTARALEALLPSMHGLRRRHGDAILDAVDDGLDDPDSVLKAAPPPDDDEPNMAPSQVRIHGRAADRVVEGLKVWRNAAAAKPGMSAFAVASNGQLKNIARARPTTLAELTAVPDVRRWQVRDHGEAILAALDKVAPWPSADDSDEESPRKKRRR